MRSAGSPPRGSSDGEHRIVVGQSCRMLPGCKHADDALCGSAGITTMIRRRTVPMDNRECNLVDACSVSLSNRCHTNPGLSANRKLGAPGWNACWCPKTEASSLMSVSRVQLLQVSQRRHSKKVPVVVALACIRKEGLVYVFSLQLTCQIVTATIPTIKLKPGFNDLACKVS